MGLKYEVVATVGKRKDGKNNYVRVGAVFETDKGLSMKLDSIPCGGEWNGWLSFFEPKDRNDRAPASQRSEAPQGHQGGGGDFEDSIPFAPIGRRQALAS